MAEIKSTMEMVMERAAKMGAASATDLGSEEKVKDGMRLGAAYLRDEIADLAQKIAEFPEQDRRQVQKGTVQTFLRNIVLPRDEDQQKPAEKAMQGLLEVGQSAGELLRVFGDMKKILDQYLQHKEQLKQQLESQFAQQMEMMEQNLARQTGMAMKLEPSQHPKFQEEWQRIKTELNDQYGRALNQHKEMVEQYLTK